MDAILLAYYSLAIVAASVFGGVLPQRLRLDHRQTEVVVSFVAGAMLGVALLHLLPHAVAGPLGATAVFRWLLGGFLAMFLIERFFCFHHHDVAESPGDGATAPAAAHGHAGCGHDHAHSEHSPVVFSWGGAAMGLTLHSLLAGVALAATVSHAPDGATLPGLGAFLAIVLHKPLDAMTIAVLMRQGGWGVVAQCLANGLFALAVPAGVALFAAGLAPLGDAATSEAVAAGLAFSAGVFLCVAMSDLLPELQFHDHDRVKLSLALVVGLGLAELAGRLEAHTHGAPAPTVPAANPATDPPADPV